MIPEELVVQRLSPEAWTKYRDLLSGLTKDNAASVKEQLVEMGILPGAGSMEHIPVDRPGKRARVDEDSGAAGATSTAALV